MPLTIEDGTGQGYRVKVSNENRLSTVASTAPREHFIARDKQDTYVTSTQVTAATLTVTTTEGVMLYFSNTSEKKMIITNTIISSGTAGVIGKFYRNPEATGVIGNANDGSEVNLNFGSSRISGVTTKVWNETGNGMTNITTAEIISGFTLPASAVSFPTDGAVILTPGSSYCVTLQSPSGTAECAISMRYYMDEEV